MESLGFFQKPLEPTPFKLENFEFLENAPLINLRVVSKLSALYERKYDRVFETGKNRSDPIQREGILREHVVGLHDIGGLQSFVLMELSPS